MKLGYPLRKFTTKSLEVARGSLDLAAWLYWAVFDPAKFKKIVPGKLKNLLVIYGGATGDVYNAIGLMNAAAAKYSDLSISFVTYEKNHKHVKNPRINVLSLKQARRNMKNGVFDSLILLQGTLNKPEFFPTGMRRDIKYVPFRAACDNMHLAFAHKQIPPSLTRRVISVESNGFEDQLFTFQKLGFEISGLLYHYTSEAEKFAEDFFKKNKFKKGEKRIFFHVGGGSILAAMKELEANPSLTADPTHKWPAERWAQVADYLIEKKNARIMFTGVGDEKKLVDEVMKHIKNKKKTMSLVDKTSIDQSASILKRGDLLITIDTGTMHIAAQTGIPIIGLFSSFKPSSTSSLAKKKIDIFHPETCTACRKYTLCPEGSNLCMRKITVEEIIAASKKFLKK